MIGRWRAEDIDEAGHVRPALIGIGIEAATQGRLDVGRDLAGVPVLHAAEERPLVEETVGKKAVVEYQPARDFDAPRVLLDTNRAQTVLGWQPKVLMKDGLAKTWEWMQATIL